MLLSFSVFFTAFLALVSPKVSADFKVMSYNVENLFDVDHDHDKNDYEFLPRSHKDKKKGCLSVSPKWRQKKCLKTDWTKKKLEAKLTQIKKVVDFAKTPEILALIEVENKNVVSMLAKKLGYNGIVVTESLDARGVDVALLYKSAALPLTFKSFKQHDVDATRSILQATFVKGKKDYHFFVNHWPSQGSPAKRRLEVASKLKKIVGSLKGSYVFAMGDFNTLPTDHPHPFLDNLLIGTSLKDLRPMLDRKKSPLGTYFYPKKMAWNSFDRIFVSHNLIKEKKVKDYQILNPSFLTGVFEYKRRGEPHFGSRVTGIPKRYNFKATKSKKMGFSDHFAVMATIKP